MAYYERNYESGNCEIVTPRNIIENLLNSRISSEEAVNRIQRLLDDREVELVTLVDKDDWNYIYGCGKEEWAKYDGVKPTGDSLKEIRAIIKKILRDELKIEKNGDFMKLNKLTYHRYKSDIEDLLYKMI